MSYNKKQMEAGRLTYDHIDKLVRLWQKEHGLTTDGLAGPNTLKSIDAGIGNPPSASLPEMTTLPLNALRIALKEIGNGEQGGNNTGPDVERYRSGDGTGLGPGGQGSWCAVLISFCYVQASGGDLPFKTSRGAKRLTNNVAAVGRELGTPQPGAVIAWHRPDKQGKITWQGHVGLVLSYDASTDTLITVEGNKNRAGQRYAHVAEFTYPNGMWRKNLYKMAILNE